MYLALGGMDSIFVKNHSDDFNEVYIANGITGMLNIFINNIFVEFGFRFCHQVDKPINCTRVDCCCAHMRWSSSRHSSRKGRCLTRKFTFTFMKAICTQSSVIEQRCPCDLSIWTWNQSYASYIKFHLKNTTKVCVTSVMTSIFHLLVALNIMIFKNWFICLAVRGIFSGYRICINDIAPRLLL